MLGVNRTLFTPCLPCWDLQSSTNFRNPYATSTSRYDMHGTATYAELMNSRALLGLVALPLKRLFMCAGTAQEALDASLRAFGEQARASGCVLAAHMPASASMASNLWRIRGSVSKSLSSHGVHP